MKNVTDKLREIADSIIEFRNNNKSTANPGLYSGTTGMLMFLEYYSRQSTEAKYQEAAEKILEAPPKLG